MRILHVSLSENVLSIRMSDNHANETFNLRDRSRKKKILRQIGNLSFLNSTSVVKLENRRE